MDINVSTCVLVSLRYEQVILILYNEHKRYHETHGGGGEREAH